MSQATKSTYIECLAEQTDASEWIRGKAYYRNGRVGAFTVELVSGGNHAVQAVVHAAKSYPVRLLLSCQSDHLLDWQCSCSHSRSGLCRHAVALLLSALHDRGVSNLCHLLAYSPCLPSVTVDRLKTDVHILFRYQKQLDRILIIPRLIKRNSIGQKIMSSNPLDPADISVSSQVNDRMTILRDRSDAFMVIDFFRKWSRYQQDLIGCLVFDATHDLALLVDQIVPAIPSDWHVLYDQAFEKIMPARKNISVDFNNLKPGHSNLLSFNLAFHCDQTGIDPIQLQDYIAGQQKWLLVNGLFVEAANKAQLGRLLGLLKCLRQGGENNEVYESDPAHIANLVMAGSETAAATFDTTFADLRSGLDNNLSWPDVSIPSQLDTLLRPYQRKGIQWLLFLRQYQLGGILADEMGLGKTLQVLVCLVSRPRSHPSLIVCPKTLMFNWLSEIRRFVPSLKAVLVDGDQSQRRMLLRQAYDFDLLITSYPLVQRDIDHYRQLVFDCCILDEAQVIKNPETHQARHVKRLSAYQRIALTGTPMENNPGELWSLFDFILPGYLGQRDAFIAECNAVDRSKLLARIRPFMLRRVKQDVLLELPAKIEEICTVPLTQNQLALYQHTLEQIRREMSQSIQQKNPACSRMAILAGLTRLRQICNHPGLLYDAYLATHGVSGKLARLEEMLRDLLANGHKVLVFSQFTQMLSIIRRHLQERQIDYCYLDGQTRDRQSVVHRFNTDHEISVFLISLKTGGFGLNLTTADTVILFDPWWNPMVENQAADRVHRIGQTRIVTIYRLITQNTIEEKMALLQERKKLQFDQIINAAAGHIEDHIDLADLQALLDHD